MRPVYLHAWACQSSFGNWPQTWAMLMEGQSAIQPIRRFDIQKFPCTVAAAIDDYLEAEDRRSPMVLAALQDLPIVSGKLGVFMGAESGRGRFQTLRQLAQAAGKPFDVDAFVAGAAHLHPRLSARENSPAAPAIALAQALRATGPVETVSLACASGLSAVVEGVRAIALGECETALCGGVGADVDPLMIAGFGKLSALSAKGVSRPFDLKRDGFVVGEGAALLLFSAQKAPIQVAGLGRSMDAHHLTMPDPQGKGAQAAMQAAIHEAGLDTIDVVQAHGTSTPLNDAVEAAALLRLGPKIHAVSSVKGALGHWIAGAGALGLCCAAESLRSQAVIPTAGLSQPDSDLPHVMGKGRQMKVQSALCNAFAFGGANASVVLRWA